MSKTATLWALCLFHLGCSWVFDDSAPGIPLLGEPPSLSSFPKLNVQPAREVYLLSDAQGLPWAALAELPVLPANLPEEVTLPDLPETVRLVRLTPQENPDTALTFPSQYLQVTTRALYVWVTPELLSPNSRDKTMFLSRLGPGEPPLPLGKFPEGAPFLLIAPGEQVAMHLSRGSKNLRIVRMDGSGLTREVPIPNGVDPAKPLEKGRFAFDGQGAQLVVQDGDDQITVYDTSASRAYSLGKRPRTWSLDSTKSALLFCTENGLYRRQLDGTEGGEKDTTQLDDQPCSQEIFRQVVYQGTRHLLYKSGDGLKMVAENGSSPPVWRLSVIGQLLATGPGGELLYSNDPPATYGSGIGDGFLGDTQVLYRGRRPVFSADGSRLRYLEWAARSDGAGDLYTRTLPANEALHLARNVRNFAGTPDGRVLAASHSVPRGTHNRVIVIDETAQEARWVADGSRDFVLIPGTNEVLVKVVALHTGWDIRRAPIPTAVR